MVAGEKRVRQDKATVSDKMVEAKNGCDEYGR